MNIPNVKNLIPHRGRFLLISELLYLSPTNVTAKGNFTNDHVNRPDIAISNVWLLEGLAQAVACAVMSKEQVPKDEYGKILAIPLLVGFEEVKFTGFKVFTPAEVIYKVTLTGQKHGITQASGEVFLGQNLLCKAIISGTYR